jgi:serine/threonine-protein kinase
MALAQLCRLKQQYAGAAGFLAEAFARQLKLATDLSVGRRYDAACYAALAGCGQGEDPAKPGERAKARLRGQALGWLRADLALWKERLKRGKPPERQAAQGTLRHWQIDPDLAGVRDQAGLAKLPEAERTAWATLWGEVRGLLAKAAGNK